MKLTRFALLNSPLLLLMTCSGCVTRALWKNENLEAMNQPATNANVHLFDSKQKKDVLVIYEEYSERHDKAEARAYWLNENERRVEHRERPRFVDPRIASQVAPMPVFLTATLPKNSLPPIYGLVDTNELSFKLFSNGEAVNSYRLPVYNDGQGKVEKVALTLPAVTADLTIVGCVLGYFWLGDSAERNAR